jgi:SAM-dependent methyltransferase
VRVEQLYETRFPTADREAKLRVWKVLCEHFFSRYVGRDDTVLDLGAGFCEFVNSIECGARIAVDANPDLPKFAAPGVRTLVRDSLDLQGIDDMSVDVVFASNFFEHLATKADMLKILAEAHRVLRHGGRLLVLQPNINAVRGRYWDFFDHHLPLTDQSVAEALNLTGFEVIEQRARFLPYTTKSALPMHPLLVRLYLAFPPAHRILGGQAWVVGKKP